MKANEFVKKYGWDVAIDEYINARNCGCYLNGKYSVLIHQSNTALITENIVFVFPVADLKRLVESWELVEKHGGLIEAKYYLHAIAVSGSDFFDALYSAVDDVESCQ